MGRTGHRIVLSDGATRFMVSYDREGIALLRRYIDLFAEQLKRERAETLAEQWKEGC